MGKFLLLLRKIHFWLIFFCLEGISLFFYVKSDTFAYSRYLALEESVLYETDELKSDLMSYISLKDQNEDLMQYNARLIAENRELKSQIESCHLYDSSATSLKNVIPLRVVRNEFLNKDNFIVLNGGTNKGVSKGMAVVCNEGIVGFVSNVSSNFAVAVSILSTQNFQSSAQVKNSAITGTLKWNGKNHRLVQVIEVSKYAKLNVGDTVVTTTYSSIFPDNFPVGRIVDFSIADGQFYSIDVETFVDMSSIRNVYVMELKNKQERDSLEKVSGVLNVLR